MAPTHIKSVDRAIQILDKLSISGKAGLSLSEVSTETGINVSTAHHLIATLLDKRVLEQDPISRRYRLGLHLIELGKTATYTTPYARIGGIHTENLAEITGQTVHLLLFRGLERIRILVAQRSDIVQIRSLPLPYAPKTLYATGSGKVLLAHLPDDELQAYLDSIQMHRYQDATLTDRYELITEIKRVKAVGYAEDHDEYNAGISAITVPVFDASNRVKGALDILFPSFISSEENLRQWITEACETAQAFSQQLLAGGHIID